jgi:hypothetical protein
MNYSDQLSNRLFHLGLISFEESSSCNPEKIKYRENWEAVREERRDGFPKEKPKVFPTKIKVFLQSSIQPELNHYQ